MNGCFLTRAIHDDAITNLGPDFHFLVKTRLTENQIRRKEARDRWEFKELRFIRKNEIREITDIVYSSGVRAFAKASYVIYLESRYPS